MDVLTMLIPISLGLGAIGLAAFIWALRTHQFDDPQGDAQRFLSSRWDDKPRPD
ncbi:cbb3-type cytochrome oxidase assembly protein CcoS [Paracoccus bogoriensis]|uniref:cbb3-type cytochrome oxidase assembly protein CcoS n=1 Tax=Paracoccus bogoriensis TaxID=242065 RepID=UPI001CA49A74|nr:cbb3-type cytochrome oxidase assembly protein CcoS [Paracoccus bogoriensis]MBW7055890.1 cbb3-type cytochrome oxidase assembly protein CcoS [Paracoccus bogoriensis]